MGAAVSRRYDFSMPKSWSTLRPAPSLLLSSGGCASCDMIDPPDGFYIIKSAKNCSIGFRSGSIWAGRRCGADGLALVRAQIVHDYDIVLALSWDEALDLLLLGG